MFDGPKYVTREALLLPEPIIRTIWKLICERRDAGAKMDRLQIFRLTKGIDKDGKGVQLIEHIQEQPPYSVKYHCSVDEVVEAKIFVIDVLGHATLLLAEEY